MIRLATLTLLRTKFEYQRCEEVLQTRKVPPRVTVARRLLASQDLRTRIRSLQMGTYVNPSPNFPFLANALWLRLLSVYVYAVYATKKRSVMCWMEFGALD